MIAIKNYLKFNNFYSIQRKNLSNRFQINYDYMNLLNKFNEFSIYNDTIQNNQVIEFKNKTSKIVARKKAKRKYKKKISLRWR
jgi:hypothetical protein